VRRVGGVWPTITSFDHLRRSAQRAARGKHDVRSAAAFLERLEPESLALQRELISGTYTPRPAFSFTIYDPKERVITAAAFRDRVVHHALIDALASAFDRRMIATSCACRKGKGTHAALRTAREFLRRHSYFLKLDVRRFFPSLAHEVVMETVGRVVKDRAALALFATILRAGGDEAAGVVGLPIGNLTSQWSANLVLDRLDHFVKETLRIPGYVRYMDDFVLFADQKRTLRAAHVAIAGFLRDRLRLELKECATLLAPAVEGLPFLGWRIFRGTTRLLPENKRRITRRLARRAAEVSDGTRTESSVAAGVRATVAHLAHGSTTALRRRWFGDPTAADGSTRGAPSERAPPSD
jgi:retron-type reverse transcriptase